jgi:ABC-2 type transport system permease protein
MSVAFVRLNAVEDLSYPLSVVLTYIGRFMPVFLYFFVAKLVPADDAQVGGDYFTFIVVGLSVTTMLDVTLIGFGKRLALAWDRGYFEMLLVAPVTWAYLPITMHLWEMLTSLVMVIALLGLGVLLGAELVAGGLPSYFLVLLLGVAACIGVGLISAALQVLTKQSGPLVALYSIAATLFSGAIFPVDLLPAALKPISFLIPHTYVVSIARSALMGEAPTGDLSFGVAVVGLLVSTVAFFTIGSTLFRRTLAVARRQGMLGAF